MVEEDEYGMVEKNPNKGGEVALREPKEILGKMERLDIRGREIL